MKNSVKKALAFSLAFSICCGVGLQAGNAFENSSPISSVGAYAEDSLSYTDENGNVIYYTVDNKTQTATITGVDETAKDVVKLPSKITVKDDVEGLEDKVYIVTTIGSSAFENNQKISEVVIPDTVTIIGYRAFYGMNMLKTVTIPDSVTTFGTSWFGSSSYAFQNCGGLKKVVLGKGITKIPENTFSDCISLKEITFSENLETIGEDAFSGCTSLADITLPKTVKTISRRAFADCESISKITLNDGLESIGDYAFAKTDVTELTIPDSVTEIGCIGGCENLTKLTVGNGVTEIPDNFCQYAKNISDITIGNDVKTIGSSAFSNTAITSIKLPDTLETIGNSTFSNTKLTTIEIPKNVTKIGNAAFSGNSELERVTYQGGAEDTNISAINYRTFESCPKLNYFIVPSSVVQIDGSAFTDCKSLDHLAIHSNTVKFNGSIIKTKDANITIYGYDKSKAQKYADENGNSFAIIPETTAYSKVFDGMKSDNSSTDSKTDDSKTDSKLDSSSKTDENVIAENIDANYMSSLGKLSGYKSIEIVTSQKNGYIYIFDKDCQKIGDIKLDGSNSYSVDLEKLANSDEYKIMITAGKIDNITATAEKTENNKVLPVTVAGGGYDINGDGVVDPTDALQILKKVVGLI